MKRVFVILSSIACSLQGSALFTALENNNAEAVHFCLSNPLTPINKRDRHGRTPLMIATILQRAAFVNRSYAVAERSVQY